MDRFYQVPRCDDPCFLSDLIGICTEHKVALLIPTIDTELAFYAAHRDRFAALGTNVAVSRPETVEISSDKTATNRWLANHNFPTVRQESPEQVLEHNGDWQFPVIAKPRWGSASIGVRILQTRDSLKSFASERDDLVVEEIAPGKELTVNVFVNQEARCLCAVPHLRIEVRGGEVSKGVTVKQQSIMKLIARVSESLPGAYGALNVQGFLSDDRGFLITEINARFGGGYPLAHEAGAEFTRWLLEEALNLPSSALFDGWQDGLAMLRYDTAVFLRSEALGNHSQ